MKQYDIYCGLFLLAKSTFEIHDKLEGMEHQRKVGPRASFAGVIIQIALLDVVFSLNSVITAVGMANQVSIMIARCGSCGGVHDDLLWSHEQLR
jgi:predicted tellurium resistance membrane protein TerC